MVKGKSRYERILREELGSRKKAEGLPGDGTDLESSDEEQEEDQKGDHLADSLSKSGLVPHETFLLVAKCRGFLTYMLPGRVRHNGKVCSWSKDLVLRNCTQMIQRGKAQHLIFDASCCRVPAWRARVLFGSICAFSKMQSRNPIRRGLWLAPGTAWCLVSETWGGIS